MRKWSVKKNCKSKLLRETKLARCQQEDTSKTTARYQGKAYLGDKIGKSDYIVYRQACSVCRRVDG